MQVIVKTHEEDSELLNTILNEMHLPSWAAFVFSTEKNWGKIWVVYTPFY